MSLINKNQSHNGPDFLCEARCWAAVFRGSAHGLFSTFFLRWMFCSVQLQPHRALREFCFSEMVHNKKTRCITVKKQNGGLKNKQTNKPFIEPEVKYKTVLPTINSQRFVFLISVYALSCVCDDWRGFFCFSLFRHRRRNDRTPGPERPENKKTICVVFVPFTREFCLCLKRRHPFFLLLFLREHQCFQSPFTVFLL